MPYVASPVCIGCSISSAADSKYNVEVSKSYTGGVKSYVADIFQLRGRCYLIRSRYGNIHGGPHALPYDSSSGVKLYNINWILI